MGEISITAVLSADPVSIRTNFNSLTGVIDLPFKAYGLSINNDGDIIVSGGGGGANNAYIRKYDTNGNLLAEKIHTTYTQALPVIQLSNGQYFACMNADLAMLDENFNFVWTKTTNNECSGIAIDTNDLIFSMSRSGQVFVYDFQGNNVLNIDNEVAYYSVDTGHFYLHSNGDFIQAGPAQQGGPCSIVRFDINGNQVWKKYYEEDDNPLAQKASFIIREDSNGDLIIFVQNGYPWKNTNHGVVKIDINDGSKLLP